MKMMTKITTKREREEALRAALRARLATRPRWALRALDRLYSHQTPRERASEATIEHNGVGFSGTDAQILSSFAEQYRTRGSLSPRQMALLHRKMPTYWRQIAALIPADQIEALIAEGAARREEEPRCA